MAFLYSLYWNLVTFGPVGHPCLYFDILVGALFIRDPSIPLLWSALNYDNVFCNFRSSAWLVSARHRRNVF